MENPNNEISKQKENDGISIVLLNKIIKNRNEELKDEPNFLDWDWNDVNIIEENYNTFLILLTFNSIEPNPIITKKVAESKILNNVNKYIIPLDSIVNELNILIQKYPELDYDSFLYYIIYYIEIKVALAIIRGINYNKGINNMEELDVILKGIFRSRRRTKSTSEKSLIDFNSTVNGFSEGIKTNNTKNSIEKILENTNNPTTSYIKIFINIIASLHEKEHKRLKGMKKTIGLFTGDTNQIMRLLPIDNLNSYKKKEVYRNLFPLFKLILVDNFFYVMKTENKKDKNYIPFEKICSEYKSYNDYKIHIVKIILGKTK